MLFQENLEAPLLDYQKALALKPDNAEEVNKLGEFYLHQRKIPEAIAACQQALKIQPDFAAAYNTLGNALEAQSKNDAAIRCYSKALNIQPDLAKAHINLARIYYKIGLRQQAIASYQKAIAIQPDLAPAYANITEISPPQTRGAEGIVGKHWVSEIKPVPPPSLTQKEIFRHKEFQVYSQNGEDGLLLYIFSKIGTTNRSFVEFGSGNGRECNTANLSINFGWQGLLMDGAEENVAIARAYYANHPNIKKGQVKITQCWISRENINQVLRDNEFQGSIDLLSLDIDGNDYWIWQAIDVIEPRVVVIEYNASLGSELALAVKYDPNFDRHKKHPSGWYHGASLSALTKLARAKGYILVGGDTNGVNAFFVRQETATGNLEEISVEDAYYEHAWRARLASSSTQFEYIKHLEFEYI